MCAFEWIAFPRPGSHPFYVIWPCFKTDVGECSFAGNCERRHKIVDVRLVADRRHEPDRGRLGLSLGADLGYPRTSGAIFYPVLLLGAALFLLNEGYPAEVRLHIRTTGT